MTTGISFLEFPEKDAFDHAEKVESGEISKESSRLHHAIARKSGGRMRRAFLFALPICLVGAAVSIGIASFSLGQTQEQTGVSAKGPTVLAGKTKELKPDGKDRLGEDSKRKSKKVGKNAKDFPKDWSPNPAGNTEPTMTPSDKMRYRN